MEIHSSTVSMGLSSRITAVHTLLCSLCLMFHISCTSSGRSCYANWAPPVISNVILCFVMKSYPRMTRTMRLKCDFSISNLTGVAWISLNAFAVSFHSFAVHHISNHLSHSLTSTLVNVLGRLMCWQRIRTSS